VPENGSRFRVLTADIEDPDGEASPLPERLSTIERLTQSGSTNSNRPRAFELGMSMGMGGMAWTINGRSFEMEAVARDEVVRFNSQETWLFDNPASGGGMGAGRGPGMGMGGMMQMAHPMHVHGVQFQVVERQVADGFRDGWESVAGGYVDEGWKDTVLVMPGERVKVVMRFEDFPGTYLNHCHNLEHEDLGMMRNFRIDQ
jgi:blue copper oxidase